MDEDRVTIRSPMEFGKICDHGQLARQCNVCELEAEVARLKAALGEACETIESFGELEPLTVCRVARLREHLK